jgi:two-component system chemotaxis response regulator CheY
VLHQILIADDSPLIRQVLRSCLERSGEWQVCGEAADGREAVEKAKELDPDLVILDLSMPTMNGFEAARELRRINPQVPLLMFTSFATPTLATEAAAAGCTATVSKSDSPQLLIDSIHRLLAAAA